MSDKIYLRDNRFDIVSVAFSSFGFVALYLSGKFHTFSWGGKGQSWKLFFFVLPLGVALAIAASRTCDYHHHWQGLQCSSCINIINYNKSCNMCVLNIIYLLSYRCSNRFRIRIYDDIFMLPTLLSTPGFFGLS